MTKGAADVVAILRVMEGIYAPAPFQLGRPSRVVYGHCFDRALYRGFERRLTPGIKWGEKRGRHAIAAFERDAWDIALSHCLERSADAGTTISNLFDFDRARRFHLPAERAPNILDCGNCAIDLSLRCVVGESIADFDMVEPIMVPPALGPLLPSWPLDAAHGLFPYARLAVGFDAWPARFASTCAST
jgi:hypothetical protein